MKTSLTFICAVLLLISCEKSTPDPLMYQIDGRWKLMKIAIGFPAPGGPTEKVPEYEEILEFSVSEQSFTRSKDGKVVEKSQVSISIDKEADPPLSKLIFEDSKTYSYLYFTAAPNYLVLHQSAPMGSVLADGNLFFYEKIK